MDSGIFIPVSTTATISQKSMDTSFYSGFGVGTAFGVLLGIIILASALFIYRRLKIHFNLAYRGQIIRNGQQHQLTAVVVGGTAPTASASALASVPASTSTPAPALEQQFYPTRAIPISLG